MIELVKFDEGDAALESSEAVKAALDKRGLRAATFYELCAFGAQHPDIQREFPVVALGSVALVNGDRHVPCLGRHGALRGLYLFCWDYGWRAHFRFAAVRK